MVNPFLHAVVISLAIHISTADITLKYFGSCEKNNNDIMKVSTSLSKFSNGSDYVKLDIDIQEPITDEYKVVTDLETSPDGQKYRKLFSIRDRKYCSSINKNLGEFWYAIERAAKIPVGECPIKKGHYKIEKFPLDLEKITVLRTVPKGFLKTTCRVYRLNGNEAVACLKALLSLK